MEERKNMPNSPENIPLLTYAWVFLLSLWGGIASNIRKIRSGAIRFSFAELIGDVVISGFIGLITYYLCKYYAIDDILSAVFVGISSHMGTRAIYALEIAISEKLKIKLPEETNTKDEK